VEKPTQSLEIERGERLRRYRLEGRGERCRCCGQLIAGESCRGIAKTHKKKTKTKKTWRMGEREQGYIERFFLGVSTKSSG